MPKNSDSGKENDDYIGRPWQELTKSQWSKTFKNKLKISKTFLPNQSVNISNSEKLVDSSTQKESNEGLKNPVGLLFILIAIAISAGILLNRTVEISFENSTIRVHLKVHEKINDKSN